LQTLERWIAETQPAPKSIEVILSHEFVRFGVVPWENHILSSTEKTVQARHSLKRLYGVRADTWTIAVEVPTFGQSSLGAAIDTELLQSLSALTQRHQIRLHVIEPWASAAIRGLGRRNRLWQPSSYLILVEGSKLLLLSYAAGSLQSCVVRRAHNLADEGLSEIVREEIPNTSNGRPQIFVCNASHREVDGSYSINPMSDTPARSVA
jgi:hypothetical protein